MFTVIAAYVCSRMVATAGVVMREIERSVVRENEMVMLKAANLDPRFAVLRSRTDIRRPPSSCSWKESFVSWILNARPHMQRCFHAWPKPTPALSKTQSST
jgi:hypothetical protein